MLNRHVTAHAVENGEITMLYSVEDGPCLDSFGIHVAQLARFLAARDWRVAPALALLEGGLDRATLETWLAEEAGLADDQIETLLRMSKRSCRSRQSASGTGLRRQRWGSG